MQLIPTYNRMLRRYLRLRGVTSGTTAIDGHQVHYYELRGTGLGPPVLFVHGLGSSGNGFYKLFHPLSRHFSRVLALDLPGNGFTPGPGGEGLGVQAQLDVLIRFIDLVAPEPHFVVGNSLGGAMSIQLAHDRPDRVKGLALVAPAGARVTDARMNALFDSLEVTSVAHAHALTLRLFHKPPLGARLLAPDMLRLYSTDSVRAVVREQRAMGFLPPEVLARLSMPTLLLWGEQEKLLPFEGVHYFREHLPRHAEIHVVKGFGHVPQLERPRELIRRLVGFAARAGILGGATSSTIR